MKKIVNMICVALFATAVISCVNQSDNNASTPQSNNESTEMAKVAREEPKANPIDKFVGRYSIKDGGPNVVEVLSDGRIIHDNVGNKRYLGKINIISDDAFMINYLDANDCIYVNDGTPIYRISDGVERNEEYVSGGGGQYTRYLVYDIKERRIYHEGYNKYQNRDIAEVRYFKMIH